MPCAYRNCPLWDFVNLTQIDQTISEIHSLRRHALIFRAHVLPIGFGLADWLSLRRVLVIPLLGDRSDVDVLNAGFNGSIIDDR